GQAICFYYDVLNRLEGKVFEPNGAACPGAPATYDVTYGYDSGGAAANALGQRTSISDDVGSVSWTDVSWTYDARGRLETVSRNFTNIAPLDSSNNPDNPYTFSYEYNSASQVTILTYPDGEQVITTYNDRGMPKGLDGTDTYVDAAQTQYDILGRLTQLELGNSITTAYNYYPFTTDGGRLENLTVEGNLLDLTYTYDNAGNITTIEDTSSAIVDQTQTFTYDTLHRLVMANTSGSALGEYNLTYGYDSLGRLVDKGG
ncbi:MAG: hypothetical protein GY792_31030, partial [Gammaproteobacteria bacterium]|nr:hypothetical protein [Gammaproteobacteria bacterium]